MLKGGYYVAVHQIWYKELVIKSKNNLGEVWEKKEKKLWKEREGGRKSYKMKKNYCENKIAPGV